LDNPEESVKVQKMEDVELVLRFFALGNGQYKDMRKGLREFLTSRLAEFNKHSENEIISMMSNFRTYIDFLYETLGVYAFAKHRVQNGVSQKKMSSFNAAVYDAIAVGTAETFSVHEILHDGANCKRKFTGYLLAFEDDDFFQSVSGATNDASKITYRINYIATYLAR
jgi:hypothetical protein